MACALHCRYMEQSFSERRACWRAREHTSSWRGRMAPCCPWAMIVTKPSRFYVSIILVVITTVKERRVVAIPLLYTNVASVGILIRNWTESATKVLVVTSTCALMARGNCRGRWHLVWLVTACLLGNNQEKTCVFRVSISRTGTWPKWARDSRLRARR